MTQEIGEVFETLDPGTVGSSTMPHKVNPKFVVKVMAEAAELRGLAGTALETGLSSHEGDAAANHLLSSVLDRAVPLAWTMTENFDRLLARIGVNAERMAENVAMSGGAIATENLMMQLAPKTGRAAAHDLIHHALDGRENTLSDVADALVSDAGIRRHMEPQEIRDALDPAGYCGDSERIAREAAEMALKLSRDLASR